MTTDERRDRVIAFFEKYETCDAEDVVRAIVHGDDFLEVVFPEAARVLDAARDMCMRVREYGEDPDAEDLIAALDAI